MLQYRLPQRERMLLPRLEESVRSSCSARLPPEQSPHPGFRCPPALLPPQLLRHRFRRQQLLSPPPRSLCWLFSASDWYSHWCYRFLRDLFLSSFSSFTDCFFARESTRTKTSISVPNVIIGKNTSFGNWTKLQIILRFFVQEREI